MELKLIFFLGCIFVFTLRVFDFYQHIFFWGAFLFPLFEFMIFINILRDSSDSIHLMETCFYLVCEILHTSTSLHITFILR